MANKADITPELLRQLLDYQPDTGLFFWRPRDRRWFVSGRWTADEQARRWNSRHAGTQAFTSKTNGYHQGTILRHVFRVHRVAWAMQYGYWPENIDHINGIRDDNRICNLRDVTAQENQKNQKVNKRNTSGHAGVCWHKGKNKWLARLSNVHLGRYDKIEDAISAVNEAKQRLGYHENHGMR